AWLPCVVERGGQILSGGGADDLQLASVDKPVPHSACGLVVRVAGCEVAALHPCAQPFQRGPRLGDRRSACGLHGFEPPASANLIVLLTGLAQVGTGNGGRSAASRTTDRGAAAQGPDSTAAASAGGMGGAACPVLPNGRPLPGRPHVPPQHPVPPGRRS